ncbi:MULTISPECIES: twin-arginine translocase TatA/TatE family subunit [Streptomyces]|uniref:Twin-arginine translocase TatA/TatE family subunit n=1 Tax=Streptomyces ortus TaxID=2867268 RepID=A0ABT3V7W4_9ACTN|nr:MULTISPECIES: twin-arginine translocase TatA/TatE family subunit [Streptomyces]MCX4235641.1 twin-arginine translocase TatA/TatE family subunit [Streptomyces ortus]
MFGLSELAVVLVVVIVVLAVKKGPDLARSAGKSARILKAEKRAAEPPAEPPAEGGAEGGAPRVVRGEVVPPKDPPTPPSGA